MRFCLAPNGNLSYQQILELQNALDHGVFCKQSYGPGRFIDQSGRKITNHRVPITIRGTGIDFQNAISSPVSSSVKLVDSQATIDQLEFWDSHIETPFSRITDMGSYFLNEDWFDRKLLDRTIPGNRVFFRTKLLDFAAVFEKDKIFDKRGFIKKGTPFYKALKAHENDFFVMSEVEKLSDATQERYRAVINGEEVESIYKVTYGDDKPISCEATDDLLSSVKKIVEEVNNQATKMPSSYACELVPVLNKQGKKEYAVSTFYHYGEVAHPVNRLLSAEELDYCLSLAPRSNSGNGSNPFNRNASANSFSCTYAKKLGFRVGDDYLLTVPAASTNAKSKKIGDIWKNVRRQGSPN